MKIFQLLAVLSKAELKLLRKAVQSPLYNTNPTVIRLFEVLRPLHPNFDDALKARQKLFKKLFPAEEYNDYKLRWHFSELTKVIEQLLLYLAQENDAFEKQKRLTEIYRNRNLHALFSKSTKNLLSQLAVNNRQQTDVRVHLHKVDLLSDAYFHPLYDKYAIKDDFLEQASESLEVYFATKKLWLTIALKNKEKLQRKTYQYNFLETITNNHDLVNQNERLIAYSQVLKLLEDNPDFEFEQYETYCFNTIAQLEKKDQQLLLINGLNYLIRQNNRGFYTPALILQWYQKGLALDLLIENNLISEATFGNIVIYSGKAKQFDWGKNFIEEYQHFLNKENRQELANYYEGLLYYLQKSYDKALIQLQQNQSKSPYGYRTKVTIIRILFEKALKDYSYFEPLIASLNNFQASIKRDKYFKQDRFDKHLNFIQLLRKVVRKLTQKESKMEVKNWLTKQLAHSEPIYGKQWFLEQIDEF